MSLAATALQPYTLGGLMQLGGRHAGQTLSDLLISPVSSFDLDFDNADESISLDFREDRLVLPALGSDCCRFATAAFQSIAPVTTEIIAKDTLAWSIIKLYYSAFYAGHSIIRILGEGCLFLDRQHANRISSLGAAMGKTPTFRVDRGLYHCAVNSAASGLRYKRASGFVGGSHEAFWLIFQKRMHDLSELILVGQMVPSESQAVFSQLRSLEVTLNMAGSGPHGALSAIRNDLQYRHSLGVWFPVQLKRREREKLSRLSAQWQKDPMSISLAPAGGDVLAGFVGACAFIVSLCRALILRIAERSSEGGRCFVCFGPLSFLRGSGLDATIVRAG